MILNLKIYNKPVLLASVSFLEYQSLERRHSASRKRTIASEPVVFDTRAYKASVTVPEALSESLM